MTCALSQRSDPGLGCQREEQQPTLVQHLRAMDRLGSARLHDHFRLPAVGRHPQHARVATGKDDGVAVPGRAPKVACLAQRQWRTAADRDLHQQLVAGLECHPLSVRREDREGGVDVGAGNWPRLDLVHGPEVELPVRDIHDSRAVGRHCQRAVISRRDPLVVRKHDRKTRDDGRGRRWRRETPHQAAGHRADDDGRGDYRQRATPERSRCHRRRALWRQPFRVA